MTDDDDDRLYDAVEKVLYDHGWLEQGVVCKCGTRDNMDGDVLWAHRVGVVVSAVRKFCA